MNKNPARMMRTMTKTVVELIKTKVRSVSFLRKVKKRSAQSHKPPTHTSTPTDLAFRRYALLMIYASSLHRSCHNATYKGRSKWFLESSDQRKFRIKFSHAAKIENILGAIAALICPYSQPNSISQIVLRI